MANDTRPNIVLIMADDMNRRDFGFLGGNVHSPALDKLVDEGVYFRQAHVPTAICAPSRHTLLTGLDPSRASKVQEFARGQRFWTQFQHGRDAVYISHMLEEAGYQTGIVGKTHGMEFKNDPYAERLESMENLGFDYAASIYAARGSDWTHHNQEWVTEGALSFLEQSQNQEGQPFFLYMAVTLLHGPNPMEELGGSGETPNWNDDVLTSTPANRLGEVDPNARITLDEVRSNREAIRNTVTQEGKPLTSAPVTWLDDGIDKVLQKLEELNIAENTLVVFLNDNGIEGGKSSVYEVGTNVPMMMYWKGKTETLSNSDVYAQSYDIVPTLLELAQATPPPEIELDGQSLVPILEGKQNIPEREYAYTAIGHTRSITKDGWKYVAFRVPEGLDPENTSPLNEPLDDISQLPPGTRFALEKYPHYLDFDQLYDLTTDLNLDNVSSPDYDAYEEINFAEDGQHQDKLVELQRTLSQHLIDLPGSFGEFKFEVSSSETWQVEGDLDLSALYNGIALKDGDFLAADEYVVIQYTGQRLGQFEFDESIKDLGYKLDYATPGQVKLLKINASSNPGQELIGGSGNDFLKGGTGDDTISGNGGNDNIQGNAGADVLDGGNGKDVLDYGNADAGVTVNLATGAASGSHAEGDIFSNFEKIFGSKFNDNLIGDRHKNFLRGLDGNDTISGNEGNDTIRGEAGADILDGGAGKDILDYRNANGGVTVNLATGFASGSHAEGDVFSNFEKILSSNFDDNLIGDSTNNLIKAYKGKDNIDGGAGNDNIHGGKDGDILTGGDGNDMFTLNQLTESLWADFDVITDFKIGSDRLNAPTAINAANINDFGNLTEFTEAAITNLLTSLNANSGATFKFESRTFIAINNGVAGFNVASDALIEITDYTGNLENLAIQ